MMKHSLLLILTTVLFSQNHCLDEDFRDKARAVLDELNQIILGVILVGEAQLSDLGAEIAADAVNAQLNTEVNIAQEYLSIEKQLTCIKNLAQTAGKNISSCLTGSEDRLNSLIDIYIYKTDECITEIRQDADSMLATAFGRIDVTITSVLRFYFILNQCTTDNCITILLLELNGIDDSLTSLITSF